MKKRNYILAALVLSLIIGLAGCGEEKKDNSQNADQTQDAVQDREEDNSEEESSTEDDQDEASQEDQTEAKSQEKALDFKVGDYVKLGEYKGLEVTYPAVAEVTDEDVQTSIE